MLALSRFCSPCQTNLFTGAHHNPLQKLWRAYNPTEIIALLEKKWAQEKKL